MGLFKISYKGGCAFVSTKVIKPNKNMPKFLQLILISLITISFSDAQNTDNQLIKQLLKLTPDSKLVQKEAIQLKFDAHHTQGMVKIGEDFFMTSVEVTQWPKRYETPQNGLDRDTGIGKGHVFKFDKSGNLLNDLPIGKGDIYHPGGIDFDGEFIWIPATEYRPNSFSIIYKLNGAKMLIKWSNCMKNTNPYIKHCAKYK